MNRTDIINYLINVNQYERYLEIGVRNPDSNFNKINVFFKEGVDPDLACKCSHNMTSDEFFTNLPQHVKYDIIFIDGLHLEKQVDKDIANSLLHLSEHGVIVMHDCNPPTEKHQTELYDGISPWNGTTWKSFVKLRYTNPLLYMCVVDTDWGIGIIHKGQQQLLAAPSKLDYSFLEKDRKKTLNLISVKEFKAKYDTSIQT